MFNFSARGPCNPSPCLHQTRCSAPTNTSYKCDCEGSLYTGKDCQIRRIETNESMIFLTRTKDSETLKLTTATDGRELRIKAIPSSPSLKVEPTEMKFFKTDTEFVLTIKASTPGFYNLTFAFTNANDSQKFSLPSPIAVISVGYKDKSAGNIVNDQGLIKPGCHSLEVGGNKYISNKPFVNQSSRGVIQILLDDGTLLPLSATGGKIDKTGKFVSYPLLSLSQLRHEKNSNIVNNGTCVSGGRQFHVTNQIILTNAFTYSVYNVFNQKSPYWIHVNVPASDDQNIHDDLHTRLVVGAQVDNDCMKNLELNEKALYYQYITHQPLEIVVPSGITRLNDTVKKCFLYSIGENQLMAFSVSQEEDQVIFKCRFFSFLNHVHKIQS